MRDGLLRLCLRAYPRAVRERDGELLLDLAREVAGGGSSALREGAGLLAGGARSRVRLGAHQLAAAPWREARALLALPLAAALFAVALFGAERATLGIAWPGWSWALTLAAAACALVAAATGRRGLTVAAALLLTGLLGHDGLRDVYGGGSRWSAPAGGAYVDVLVMWLPAAVLLVACAGAVERHAGQSALARTAWAALPGAVLLFLSAELSTANLAQSIVVLGGLALACGLVVLGIALRRTHAALTRAAALALAAAAAPALWLSATLVPLPSSGAAAVSLLYFGLTGALAAGAVAGLARLAAR